MSNEVASNFGNRHFRQALLGCATIWFFLLVADQFMRAWAKKYVPSTLVYFAQVSGLFPKAARNIIEYRAEGWLCGEQRYVELDMTQLFPMLAGNKENRFYRAMHFFRNNKKVMRSLDSFTVRNHPFVLTRDGMESVKGVRFLSLRIPLPESPAAVKRHRWEPLGAYPEKYRVTWYSTSDRALRKRCDGGA